VVDATVQGPVASAMENLTGFPVQAASTSGRASDSDNYTGTAIMSTLWQSSLQPSSIPTYRLAWQIYSQFSQSVLATAAISMPLTPSNPDPTRVFWVMEMLKGYRKLGPRIDSRLPVTLPILRNIIAVARSLCSSVYICSSVYTVVNYG
jgi:hypothetical protein